MAIRSNGDIDLGQEAKLRLPFWSVITFFGGVVTITASVVWAAATLRAEVQKVSESSAANNAALAGVSSQIEAISSKMSTISEQSARQDERLKAIESSVWRKPQTMVEQDFTSFGL